MGLPAINLWNVLAGYQSPQQDLPPVRYNAGKLCIGTEANETPCRWNRVQIVNVNLNRTEQQIDQSLQEIHSNDVKLALAAMKAKQKKKKLGEKPQQTDEPKQQPQGCQEFPLIFHEDNQGAIAIMKSGKNQQIRHMNRTHQVSHRWLHEVVTHDPAVTLKYCESKQMRADLMTKAFFDPGKFEHATSQVGLIRTALAKLAYALQLPCVL